MSEHFHPDRVSEDDIHAYAIRNNYLDADADSKVFRVGPDWVLKEYYRLSVPQAEAYQYVTTVGSRIAPTITGEVKGYGDTTLAVTPMVRVIKSAKNSMTYGIAPYADGERGFEFRNESWDKLITQLAVAVMAQTGYVGIHTIASNSKMQTWYSPNRIEVTDLCAQISKLRKR